MKKKAILTTFQKLESFSKVQVSEYFNNKLHIMVKIVSSDHFDPSYYTLQSTSAYVTNCLRGIHLKSLLYSTKLLSLQQSPCWSMHAVTVERNDSLLMGRTFFFCQRGQEWTQVCSNKFWLSCSEIRFKGHDTGAPSVVNHSKVSGSLSMLEQLYNYFFSNTPKNSSEPWFDWKLSTLQCQMHQMVMLEC